jgi:hypothetical protein
MPSLEQGEYYMPVEARTNVFETGVGIIEPTGEYTISEIIESSDREQKSVEDPHVVCVDARHSATEKQPVREKVAGGNLYTFLYAAAAVKWSLFTDATKAAGPNQMAEEAADFLVKADEKLGAHLEDCGAINKAVPITDACAEHAHEDEWVRQAKRDLGELFNPEHWTVSQQGYAELAKDDAWRNWDANKIQEIVADRGGVVEKLDGSNPRPDIDPNNERHGHFEEATRVNHEKGKSNDRDNAKILKFQVDVDPIVRMAKKAATNEEEFSLLLHAEVMRQYATLYVLAKNQPLFS